MIEIVYTWLLPARCLDLDGWGWLNLWCNLLVVAWVASGLVVKMEGILIVGSPLAGLAGLPLALRRGYRSRCGEVGCCLRFVEDVVCAVEDSIDDGRWLLEART